ncbi:MAG: thioredoxin domain-containing protein [Bdellovibrionales bacterium]|nr:thioredoxin domain-containing protein [Bdellovibrionales bacterium]
MFKLIENNPKKFMDSVNKAVRSARAVARQEAEGKKAGQKAKEFANPKKPVLKKDRVYFGSPSATITIVEYSDFQCPYCTRGFQTMKALEKKYGKKLRILYKHLPLDDLHPQARLAARFFEAIGLQSPLKARKFHDKLFQNQSKIKKGKSYLTSVAKQVGANVAKVLKDINSSKVKNRIKADMAEARKFGFSGTPAFLINGVSLAGAYPAPAFISIIEKHLKNKK